ncbi:MAG: ATP-binding protein [Agriterribacter sp.]
MPSMGKKHTRQNNTTQTISPQKGKDPLYADIEQRFGIVPNLFRLPEGNPEIITHLWKSAVFAYLDNPLPSLFKERLFVYLSRFCKVRYCITRHLGFLIGLGHIAGDAAVPPQSVSEVMSLIKRILPRNEQLNAMLEKLFAMPTPLAKMPGQDSTLEEIIFACSTHIFLQTAESGRCDAALRHSLSEPDYNYLLLLLTFIRTAHYWSEAQTNLQLESDIEELLATDQKLAELLLTDPEATTGKTPQAVMDEFELLRIQKNKAEKLLSEEQWLREKQEAALVKTNKILADKIARLEKASDENRASRRAALNLMEDALLSKEALRINEERMRRQKEAFQAAVNGAPLHESLNTVARMVVDETQGKARTAFYIAEDNSRVLHPVRGAGNMPAGYLRQIDNASVGENPLACGLATPTGEPVLTTDVFEEPLWKPWLYLAEEYNFRGCWSFPIRTRENKSVGIFAMYFSEARKATPNDLALAGMVTQTAAVIIANDMEAQKRAEAEEALRQSEERYRVALASANMAAWDWNIEEDKVKWNDQHFFLLGLSPREQEVRPALFLQFVHKDDAGRISDALKQGVEVTGLYHEEFRIVRADNEVRWMNGYGKAISKKNGRATRMIGVMFDVTERKRLEQQKEDFISIASHELKTPMTSIKTYAEVLHETLQKTNNPAAEKMMQKLNVQVDRLIYLIRTLLDTSNLEGGELMLKTEPFELWGLIDEQVQDLQQLSPGHHFITSGAKECMVVADRERIAQVFTNLIFNAIKYSPRGGDIVIEWKKLKEEVEVSVRDQGIGIPQEAQQKLFTRFFRVKTKEMENYPGMGLGLYITAQIVNRHGGKIWLESAPGKGSTFYFTLPLAK